MNWQQKPLGDVIQFKNGKKRPASEGTVPVYGGNGILGYANDSNYNQCIIIGRVGAYCGSVYYEKNACWVSDNAIAAQPKSGTDIRFAYYLLKNLNLNKRHIGTSQPLLTQEILNRIECKVPPLQKQKQIASILSAFDDKIELNHKINDNLQQQFFAVYQAKYQYPPKNEVWQNGCIGDVVNLQRGYDLPKDKVINGNYPVAGSTGTIAYHSDFTTEPPCIVMGRSGNIGNPRLYLKRCWAHNTTLFSKEYKNSNPYWVYAMLKFIDYRQFQGGSAVPTLNRNHVHAFSIDIPPKAKQDELGKFASPLFNMIIKNDEESKNLCTIRDSLLPKLMSGEIDVRSVNN